MAGGTPAWEENDLFLLGSEASDIEIAEDDDGAISIDDERFVELVEEEGATVLDVRDDDEVDRSGLIPDAIHIPSGALTSAPSAFAGNLPDDTSTPIVVHCAAGVRSRDAAETLVDDLGYENVYYLDERIRIDEDGSYSF